MKRISAQINVPIIYRAYGSHTMNDSITGLGDVSLLGNVRILQHATKDWSVRLVSAWRHQAAHRRFQQAEPP